MSERPSKRAEPIGPETQPDDALDLAELKRKSIRGGSVTVATQAVSVVIQLASTVILARLLTPEDYGVLAMVSAVTAFAGLFQDLGLSAAAIQKKNITNAQQSNLFGINLMMGVLLTVLVASISPLVAGFFEKPEVLGVTVALSFDFLIRSFGAQSNAVLVRNMQFGRQAIARISGAVAYLVTAVTFALQGASYWSLVWGTLVGGLTTTVLLVSLSPFRPTGLARGTGVREMAKFGANITGFSLVNYFARNLDNILIGRFNGAEALGFYSRAYALLMFPIQSVREPINAVAFPAMSRLQGHPAAFRDYYRRITQVLAFTSMPMTSFLFVASAPLIDILLGPGWSEVSRIFALLAITGFIQPVASLRGNVLLSLGRGNRYLQWGIFNAVCVSFGFLIGIRWGIFGIASSYAIVNYLILYPSLLLAFKDTPLRPVDFFRSIAIPAAASLAAALLSSLASGLLDYLSLRPVIDLIALGAVFLPAYLVSVAMIPGGRKLLVQLAALLPPFPRRRF